MLHTKELVSNTTMLLVALLAALAVSFLAQQASYTVSVIGSQIGSSLDEQGCSYSVLSVCIIRPVADRLPMSDLGEVVFYDDDEFGIGFYREVLDR